MIQQKKERITSLRTVFPNRRNASRFRDLFTGTWNTFENSKFTNYTMNNSLIVKLSQYNSIMNCQDKQT